MTVKIYHNPRCSKSRQTLALLEEKGLVPKIILYLEESPSVNELKSLARMLGVGPKEFIRKKEAVFRELNLDAQSVDDDQLFNAMAAHPILIERPIVVNGDRAAIGRPPENVLKII